jgi:hypothetical protein
VDLAKSHFAKDSRYRKLFITYEAFITAFEGLCKLGYLKIVKKGVYDSANKIGWNTKVRGTDKLITLLTGTYCLKLPHVEIAPEKPGLILKNSDNKEIPFKPTAITCKYEDNLAIINRRLSRSWIDLNILDSEWETLKDRIAKTKKPDDVKVLDLTRRRLYRVFNNSSFEAGGRFYGGWWQRLPKEYRKHVTIDGKATIEIDYSGLHPAILYAEAGAEIPDDPYDPCGIGLPSSAREAVKKAMLVLLNAGGTISHETKREIKEATGLAWDEIQRRLIEKHQPIASSLNSGAWSRLQFADSQLAEAVMLKFSEWRAPCLPVHDSFIVHHGYRADLQTLMEEAFKERYGRSPKVKPSQVVFDPSDKPGMGVVSVSMDLDDILGHSALNQIHETRVREAMAILN